MTLWRGGCRTCCFLGLLSFSSCALLLRAAAEAAAAGHHWASHLRFPGASRQLPVQAADAAADSRVAAAAFEGGCCPPQNRWPSIPEVQEDRTPSCSELLLTSVSV